MGRNPCVCGILERHEKNEIPDAIAKIESQIEAPGPHWLGREDKIASVERELKEKVPKGAPIPPRALDKPVA